MWQTGIWILIFLVTVVIHEVCHGWAACFLGDPTARDRGRLSLNPLRHIDPFWTVAFPAVLFISTHGHFAIGMAKPVPVNFSRLRNRRRDTVLVAAAGPLANILLAGGLAALVKVWATPYFLYALYFNLGIAMFNLIPIPPLDGSRILESILPASLGIYFARIERWGFVIILVLYLSGMLLYWVLPGMDFFCRVLDVPTLNEFLAFKYRVLGGA